jgi:predicted phosphodiesterase
MKSKIPSLLLLSSFLLGFKKHTGFVEQPWSSSEKVRIILIGDTGQLPVENDSHKMNQQQRADLRSSLQMEGADAIVDLGDLFYWKGPRCKANDDPIDSGKLLDAHIYDHVGGLDTPVFLVLGNHDVGPLSEYFKRIFFGAQSGKRHEARERCYRLQDDLHEEIFFPGESYGVDFGPLRMAVLHTSAPHSHWAATEVRSFLYEESEDWTLLAGHHVLQTGCDKENENILFPWLQEHEIQPDFYANGHAHLLQLGMFEQIMAITSGSGSKLRTPNCNPTDTEGVMWGESQFGYAVLEATSSTMKLQFKNLHGTELFCWEQGKNDSTGHVCVEP